MLVKKLTLLGVASVATLGMTFASAGGSVDVEKSGFYVGANAGMFYRNQQDEGFYDAQNPLGNAGSTYAYKHGKYGFTYGAFLGYQFDNYFGLEVGWNHIPNQSTTRNNAAGTAENKFVLKDNGLAYVAGTGTLPLFDSLDVFAKVGAAYSYNKLVYTSQTTPANNQTHSLNKWNVVFATGLEYGLTDSFDLGAQMMVMPSATNRNWVDTRTDNTSMNLSNLYTYTVYLKYRF